MMKKILVFLFVITLFSSGCEKKEQQKAAQPPFSGPMQTQGQLQGQIQKLQEMVSQNPQDVRAWVQLGNMLMDTHSYQEAIDAYQKSLALDPKNINVMVDMGTCYRNIGQPQKAVEEYKKALAINPDHINAHRNLGVVAAFDLKDKKLAAKALEEYLRLAPGAPDAAQVRQLIASLKAP
jgi:cytochrome c-type biogenesis protein CcmH/NrfG